MLETCNGSAAQNWSYTLAGNLVNAGDKMCLTNQTAGATGQPVTLQMCGHNQLNQIWSLPN
jgi:alpha-galactosidase